MTAFENQTPLTLKERKNISTILACGVVWETADFLIMNLNYTIFVDFFLYVKIMSIKPLYRFFC
jgi:hypothetical protein